MSVHLNAPRWRERFELINSTVNKVSLPDKASRSLPQNREWCEVELNGSRKRIRFHDYAEIYRIPGLYEELFYRVLKCCSPSRVAELLAEVLTDQTITFKELRVLDVGAGNGMVGDEFRARGASHITGIDIVPEARFAAERDRPGVYNDYLVVDLTKLTSDTSEKLRACKFNCLTVVAALGFADIPPEAFTNALEFVADGGWVVFNVKEDFLKKGDDSGFAALIKELTGQERLRIESLRRYPHRLSVSGAPLYYVAVVARKTPGR